MKLRKIKKAATFTAAAISVMFLMWIAISAVQIGFHDVHDAPITTKWNYFVAVYGE